ncbi:Cation efflux protein [Kalmanozyma brasiliensis GHG001]|uniref:Cation efflux protein transmembrane domain-containing protein n=1 Tax=Kalmanozyma brasiliensis (strain GHG001) TaxID=1365824 RepID=V5EWW7_KALBG|nr:Cation efflux protein [Kalmanozyma brasiliensis GHG001]EST06859.1 Cation efflux protein [Kalmanozyma brasiliensis GHG001]
MSKPIDAPSAQRKAPFSSNGQSAPLSSSVRFHPGPPDHEPNTSIDSISSKRFQINADGQGEDESSEGEGADNRYSSSFNDSAHRSSSFGIAAPAHGFPSSSAYSYKAMISKHGHGFPDRAESVRNISVLANLVDYRSNYYEDHRVSEEEIKHRTRHLGWSKASAVSEYYERLNDILDGWREIDEILDSRFPEEVMRRFSQQDETRDKKKHRPKPGHKAKKRRNKQQQQQQQQQTQAVESDGNISDEEETDEEETRGRNKRPLKRSFSAKAINAFSGLWFGGSGSPRASHRPDLESNGASRSHGQDRRKPKGRAFDLTEEDEDEDDQAGGTSRQPLSSSPSGMIESRQSDVRRDYGATSASSAGQLYDKLRREGRIEQIRRSESQIALASGASTPTHANGTQTPREGISAPSSTANTIRPNQVENIPEHQSHTLSNHSQQEGGKLVQTWIDKGSLDREYSRERRHRPYVSQEEERQALLSTVPNRAKEEELSRSVQFAININLIINILLLAGKGFAVLSSNSVSLIASFVDSALDLLSTIIIFATSKAIAYRSWRTMYKYPVGKQRLEPLGVVIFSVLMIASFVQVFIESATRLREVLSTGKQDPESAASLPFIGVAFMLATIGIKTVMWLLYRSSKSSGVRAVAQDAENDVVFNIASLIFPIVGSKLGWPALDPIGGVVLSVYIIYEWIETLWETVSKLSGAVASSTEISKCLYCVVRFNSVNSVSAFELFHSGDNLIVEADIVLPHSISLKESHDLGEIITYCTENISGVERSYIHLDYNPKGQAGHLTQRG